MEKDFLQSKLQFLSDSYWNEKQLSEIKTELRVFLLRFKDFFESDRDIELLQELMTDVDERLATLRVEIATHKQLAKFAEKLRKEEKETA